MMSVPVGFDEIATSYDLMVRLSPGYHGHLRRSVRRLGLVEPAGRSLRLLDLGCGTGASTRAILSVHPTAEITAVDASAGMLAAAQRKRWPERVRFVHARAERVAAALAAVGVCGDFDGILAAYLVRNVTDRDGVLRDVRALLAPGGRLAVHEFSVAGSRRTQLTWRLVCRSVITPTGWLVSRHTALYHYLERSVLEFDGVPAFQHRMSAAGFADVSVLPMSGWQRGILHTFLGTRPPPWRAPP